MKKERRRGRKTWWEGQQTTEAGMNSWFIAAIFVDSGCGKTRLTANSLHICACMFVCMCVCARVCLTVGMDNWFDSPLSPSGWRLWFNDWVSLICTHITARCSDLCTHTHTPRCTGITHAHTAKHTYAFTRKILSCTHERTRGCMHAVRPEQPDAPRSTHKLCALCWRCCVLQLICRLNPSPPIHLHAVACNTLS